MDNPKELKTIFEQGYKRIKSVIALYDYKNKDPVTGIPKLKGGLAFIYSEAKIVHELFAEKIRIKSKSKSVFKKTWKQLDEKDREQIVRFERILLDKIISDLQSSKIKKLSKKKICDLIIASREDKLKIVKYYNRKSYNINNPEDLIELLHTSFLIAKEKKTQPQIPRDTSLDVEYDNIVDALNGSK
ncbi:MAG TPA: hypothetical protein VJ438_05275 [Candidatus Nanoarchaeia archaeon]|nr:hypothetical protein [Candidatus Nanoarchaeia archaeon]